MESYPCSSGLRRVPSRTPTSLVRACAKKLPPMKGWGPAISDGIRLGLTLESRVSTGVVHDYWVGEWWYMQASGSMRVVAEHQAGSCVFVYGQNMRLIARRLMLLHNSTSYQVSPCR